MMKIADCREIFLLDVHVSNQLGHILAGWNYTTPDTCTAVRVAAGKFLSPTTISTRSRRNFSFLPEINS